MIESANEFRHLRTSDDPDAQRRATADEAPLPVWREVAERFLELRWWVAQNKTVPGEILAELSGDPDPRVRGMVAMKRRLAPELQMQLAGDPDEGVRQQLVANARVSRAALERLADDPVAHIVERARTRLTAGDYVE